MINMAIINFGERYVFMIDFVGNRIKKIRTNLGLTQAEFAHRLNRDGSYIARLEKKENDISEKVICLICDTFNINEDWLKRRKGEMYKDNNKTKISNELIVWLKKNPEIVASLNAQMEKDFKSHFPIFEIYEPYIRIRELRTYLKLTQTQISIKIGITRSISDNIIEKLSSELDVSKEWIRNGEDPVFIHSEISSEQFYRKNIAIRVQYIRKKLKMTRKQVADRCNIAIKQVEDLENSHTSLDIEILSKVADGLKINKEWLLKGNGKISM